MKPKHLALMWLRRLLVLYSVWWVVAWLMNSPNAGTIAAIAQILLLVALVIGQAILWIGAMMWFMSKTREEKILPGSPTSVTLDSYWGQPQIKELVRQWVSLLTNPKEYSILGGMKPKGVLLEGPPGYGKSFLAKCLAGSANVPFVSMDASSLRSVWFGMGSVKVMVLFRRARALAAQYGACIVFMDEIDSIGQTRGTGQQSMYGGGGGELNTLLYELDGKIAALPLYLKPFGMLIRLFDRKWLPKETDDVVFFMGATNRPGVLDPALRRAGRLNRSIPVGKPEWDGRREIVAGYVAKVKNRLTDANIIALTDETADMSPADIRQLALEEATRKAHFRGSEFVEMKDFEDSLVEVRMGLKNPFTNIKPEERRALAAHEAGHAVLAWVLSDVRIATVTIIRYGDALGHVSPVPTYEKKLNSLRDYYHELVLFLGGRAGEIVRSEPMVSVGGDYPGATYYMDYLLRAGMWGTPYGTEWEFSQRYRALFDKGLGDAKALLVKYEGLHDALIADLLASDELRHDEVVALWAKVSGDAPRPQERLELPKEPDLAHTHSNEPGQ